MYLYLLKHFACDGEVQIINRTSINCLKPCSLYSNLTEPQQNEKNPTQNSLFCFLIDEMQ